MEDKRRRYKDRNDVEEKNKEGELKTVMRMRDIRTDDMGK